MKKNPLKIKLLRALAVTVLAVITAAMPPCLLNVSADDAHSDVAGSGETASSKPVGRYGMTPIQGSDVKDGTYDIDVDVSSPFFRIDSCKLTVKSGEMTAVIQLDTSSYSLIYNGTGEDAAKADASDYIEIKEDDDGYSSFSLPVGALDQQISIASFSTRKKKWYDRTILFDATSLPASSLDVTLPDFDAIEDGLKASGYDTKNLDASNDLSKAEKGADADGSSVTSASASSDQNTDASSDQSVVIASSSEVGENGLVESEDAVSVDQGDGEYSIEVNMTGGSGRASVTSPTLLIIRNGRAYAKLYWSSTYYDYMIVNGVKYLNNTRDGGTSTFIIPITAMDKDVSVVADTTAMGDPVEITYQLTFYEDTIGSRNLVPQIATRRVLVVALFIILGGALLSFLTRKTRYR